ncbi:MAG: FAD:protein FMN transferase [Gammaproteobacteria bacterium SHHR-1]
MALVGLLSGLLLAGCVGNKNPAISERILAFGTLIDVTIVGATKAEAKAAMEQLQGLFTQLHRDWHAWEQGPVQQINARLRAGESLVPSPVVAPLLRLSIPLAEDSDHLFNPAVGDLIDLWGFQGKPGTCDHLPDDKTIKALVAKNPRLSDLSWQGDELSSGNPALRLDFGAVGKGYGVDLAIERLRGLGIEHAMVNAGGDLRAIGNRSGRPWRIGIKHPDGSVLGALEISGDESVFTSGNYERQYRCNGQLYHHIIDPRTGYPARGTDSVTVIHKNAATADAAATALFIAGPERWQEIAQRMGISEVALLDDQGHLYLTPQMERRLKLLNTKVRLSVVSPREGG